MLEIEKYMILRTILKSVYFRKLDNSQSLQF